MYEYADGVRLSSCCRQQAGCYGDMSVRPRHRGTGHVTEQSPTIEGDKPWRFRGKDNDIYQTEHDDLFASIRAGKPINQGRTWPTAR